MDKFIVKGGRPLKGTLKVEGSKNAALPIIFGALLIAKGDTVIKNVPPLRDIFTAIEVLEYLGAVVHYDQAGHTLTVNAANVNKDTAPYELMVKMRASFLVLGPLLARMGKARVSLPGGCVLGSRPVDFHIKAFGRMGAKIYEKGGYVVAEADQLEGGEVYFDRPSHTGTENILFGAIFAKKKTVITNAACDPEIVDVAEFLNKAGAKIYGAGTPQITVEPVKSLKNIEYSVAGDRLVAGTFMMGAAITGGEIKLNGIDPAHLTMVNQKLVEMGCEIKTGKNSITLKAPGRTSPVNITTFPFPGFPTDLQACIMAVCCLSTGTSFIRETVFNDRFSHTMELRRLGADITVTSDEALINGVKSMTGASIMSSDIRAGAGILLAALAAKGKSEIMRVYHIDRGYYQIEEKLNSLGADVTRVKE